MEALVVFIYFPYVSLFIYNYLSLCQCFVYYLLQLIIISRCHYLTFSFIICPFCLCASLFFQSSTVMSIVSGEALYVRGLSIPYQHILVLIYCIFQLSSFNTPPPQFVNVPLYRPFTWIFINCILVVRLKGAQTFQFHYCGEFHVLKWKGNRMDFFFSHKAIYSCFLGDTKSVGWLWRKLYNIWHKLICVRFPWPSSHHVMFDKW